MSQKYFDHWNLIQYFKTNGPVMYQCCSLRAHLNAKICLTAIPPVATILVACPFSFTKLGINGRVYLPMLRRWRKTRTSNARRQIFYNLQTPNASDTTMVMQYQKRSIDRLNGTGSLFCIVMHTRQCLEICFCKKKQQKPNLFLATTKQTIKANYSILNKNVVESHQQEMREKRRKETP